MAQEWAKSFYRSKKWWRCRSNYISHRIMTDGGLCEECREMPGEIVHHKITLTPDNIQNPEVSLCSRNLEYVCKNCHDRFEGHGLGRAQEPLCRFDAAGQPISLREVDGGTVSIQE